MDSYTKRWKLQLLTVSKAIGGLLENARYIVETIIVSLYVRYVTSINMK